MEEVHLRENTGGWQRSMEIWGFIGTILDATYTRVYTVHRNGERLCTDEGMSNKREFCIWKCWCWSKTDGRGGYLPVRESERE